MRIAFIGQKNLQEKKVGIEKNVDEISVHLAKKGHTIFAYVQDEVGTKKVKAQKGLRVIKIPSVGIRYLDNVLYVFLSTVHAIFCGCDIIHFNVQKQKFSDVILKVLKKMKKAVATFTIPSGINIHYAKKTNHISKLELKDKKYILTVGELKKERGLHYLIEVFKQLEDTARTSNNFKLVIVGDNLQDDEYVRFLQTISTGRNNIVFAGEKNGEALEQLYSHAYLFVDPSESAGSQEKLLEAMGHGLTPLVSDIKENLEIIDGSGFSFSSKSIADLRGQLASLLIRPDEVNRNGILAKKRIRKEFGWDSVVEKITNAYSLILKENN